MSRLGQVALVVLAGVAFGAAFGCHDIHLDYDREPGAIDVFDNLFAIDVADDEHAVAVGYYGSAYYTKDGGESWRKGSTGTQLLLYGVSMADADTGWAVGQLGTILRTEDGGETWTQQPNLKQGEGSHLFSVAAIDRNTAVAVGAWGTRIRTSDGGRTWDDLSFTISEDHSQYVWLVPGDKERVRRGEKVYEDVTLNDVYCLRAPEQRCWLIGEFGYIFYSEDGGSSWERSQIAGSTEMRPVELGFNEIRVSPEEARRIGEFGRSIAGEAHLNVAIEAVGSAREMQAVAGEGVEVDTVFLLFETLDARTQEVITVLEGEGIDSDRLRRRGQPPWDFEDFLEDDPKFLDRYLARQTNEYPGVKVRVIQNPYLFKVRFRDAKHGLISALGGVILRSNDGGHSFEYRKIDRQQALFSAAAIDGRAVVVGEKGLIRVSVDDGDSWQAPLEGNFPRVFTFMRDVAFAPSGKLGLIVGQQGRIYRSNDAGFRWTKVLFPPQDRPDEGSEKG